MSHLTPHFTAGDTEGRGGGVALFVAEGTKFASRWVPKTIRICSPNPKACFAVPGGHSHTLLSPLCAVAGGTMAKEDVVPARMELRV